MDDIGKLFRGLFGFNPGRRRDDSSWQDWNDDDHENPSGDGCPSDRHDSDKRFDFFFGNRRGGYDLDGMFEHFHGDMWRHMESLHRQMEDMMRGFGAVEFPSEFDPSNRQEPMLPGEDRPRHTPDDNEVRIWFGTPSPFFRPGGTPEKKSPRDFMLKDDSESEDRRVVRPPLPAPSNPNNESHVRSPFPFFSKPGWSKVNKVETKQDTDLDGKLSDKEVLDLIKKRQEPEPAQPAPSQPRMSSWGKSVRITRVLGPDGKLEEKRVVRDSAGHEESTVRKSMGDQSYTVTTVTGEDGRTETKETFENMEEKDINKFENKWKTPSPVQPHHPADSLIEPSQRPPQIDPHDRDIFSKLFGGRDK